MQVRIPELAGRYAAMWEEEFILLRRQELIEEARPIYDQERGRRGLVRFEVVRESEDNLLARIDRRRRWAGLGMCLTWLLLTAAGLYYGLVLGGLVSYLLMLYFMGPTRGDKLVIWLRRFHVANPKALRFNTILASACAGLGFPVTVQDSTFRRSHQMAMSQIILWQPRIFLTASMPMALVGYVTYLTMHRWGRELDYLFLFVSLAASIPLIITWIYFYLRLSCLTLKPATARVKTEKVIDKIQRQDGVHMSGTFVVKCEDSFWRETVELFLKARSAAVIDVTEVSENVLWEIGIALRVLGPESIVLTYGVVVGNERRFGEEREVQLAERFGDGLRRAQRFVYPLSRRQFNRDGWGSRKELTLELRKKLAVGMTYVNQRVAIQEAFG